MAPKLPYCLVPTTYSAVASASRVRPPSFEASCGCRPGARVGRRALREEEAPTPNFSRRRLDAAAEVEYTDSVAAAFALATRSRSSRSARSRSRRSRAALASLAAPSSSDSRRPVSAFVSARERVRASSVSTRRRSAFSFIRRSRLSDTFGVVGDVTGAHDDDRFLSIDDVEVSDSLSGPVRPQVATGTVFSLSGDRSVQPSSASK